MDLNNIKQISNKLDDLNATTKNKALKKLNQIVEMLPIEISNLIESAFQHKRIPKEYLLSSILFAISTSVGLTFFMEALGYKNYGNLYFTIVGSRGDSKSEAMKIAIKPIKEFDDRDYQDYLDDISISEPANEVYVKRRQSLIQNASIEAVHKIHHENPNSIGISMDEVFSLIEKMGNPNSRDGLGVENFLLEGYNNGAVDVARKTTKSFRIIETYPTFLDGLQYQFIPKMFHNGNLESGFIDRQLITAKLTENNKLSREPIDEEIMCKYQKIIHNVLNYKRQSESPEETKKQFQIKITKEAFDLLCDYTQELIERQSFAKPLIKEYMAKMQISVHKLSVVVFMMQNALKSTFIGQMMDANTIRLAIELNEFYLLNFKFVLEEYLSSSERLPSVDDVIKLAKKNNSSQTAVVEITGMHKGTISKKWNNK